MGVSTTFAQVLQNCHRKSQQRRREALTNRNNMVHRKAETIGEDLSWGLNQKIEIYNHDLSKPDRTFGKFCNHNGRSTVKVQTCYYEKNKSGANCYY